MLGRGEGCLRGAGGAAAHAHDAPAAGVERDRRGLGAAGDRDRVGLVGDAQRDADAAVGQQRIAHRLGGPLGAEHQVHAERPATCGEVDEQPVQVGQLLQHRGELVDHDDQPGEAIGLLDRPRALLGQCALAAAQLGAQALDRAARAGLVEVGHDAHDVREPGERREGGAALEVDEQERHLVGGAPGGHRRDPPDEQLALARAGRAADHRVRPVAHEVELDRLLAGQEDRREPTPPGGQRGEVDVRRQRAGTGDPRVLRGAGERLDRRERLRLAEGGRRARAPRDARPIERGAHDHAALARQRGGLDGDRDRRLDAVADDAHRAARLAVQRMRQLPQPVPGRPVGRDHLGAIGRHRIHRLHHRGPGERERDRQRPDEAEAVAGVDDHRPLEHGGEGAQPLGLVGGAQPPHRRVGRGHRAVDRDAGGQRARAQHHRHGGARLTAPAMRVVGRAGGDPAGARVRLPQLRAALVERAIDARRHLGDLHPPALGLATLPPTPHAAAVAEARKRDHRPQQREHQHGRGLQQQEHRTGAQHRGEAREQRERRGLGLGRRSGQVDADLRASLHAGRMRDPARSRRRWRDGCGERRARLRARRARLRAPAPAPGSATAARTRPG